MPNWQVLERLPWVFTPSVSLEVIPKYSVASDGFICPLLDSHQRHSL